MKNPFLRLYCFFLLFSTLSAIGKIPQSKKNDSLKTLLRNYDLQKQAKNQNLVSSDSTKVDLLIGLSEQLYQERHDSESLHYSGEALALSKQINYEQGEAKARKRNGIYYTRKDNYTQAEKEFLEALKIWIKIGDKINAGHIHNNIGIIYRLEGNLPRAASEHLIALKLLEETADKRGIADSHHNIGIVYKVQGDYEDALKEYIAALNIRKEINDEHGIANSYNNIGNIYLEQGNYDEALKQHFASMKIKEQIGDKFGLASSHTNIGNIYYKQANYAAALLESKAALKISESIGSKIGISGACIDIGNIYTKQKKYKEALEFLNKGLLLSKEIGVLIRIKDSYYGLSALDSAQRNFKLGWEHLKLYYEFRDSLFNTEKSQRIKQLQLEYAFDKKEALTKAQHDKDMILAVEKNKRQKLFLIIWISGFAVMLLIVGVFYYQHKRISREKQRSDELLLNILPDEVAEELKTKGSADAKYFDEVTVMFTDFKNFTQVSEKLSAADLVKEIHFCYCEFDRIISSHHLEKIKTIGDAYMCAGGLPVPNKTNAEDTVIAALEIRDFMLAEKTKREEEGNILFEIRIGIHTGPVVAGIVGIKKFAYDIWGDTVNIAARMESSGEAGKVNISGGTYELVKGQPAGNAGLQTRKFNCIHRGKIQAKNKGEIDMYFVERGG